MVDVTCHKTTSVKIASTERNGSIPLEGNGAVRDSRVVHRKRSNSDGVDLQIWNIPKSLDRDKGFAKFGAKCLRSLLCGRPENVGGSGR